MRPPVPIMLALLLIVLTSGCTMIEDSITTMSPDSIYASYKDSVVYLDMACNITIAYSGFDIEHNYDNHHYDDYLTIELKEYSAEKISTYESGSYGSGFIANGKIVSNFHVVDCNDEIELFYLQNHLLYLNELAINYYLNESDIDYLVNFSVKEKAKSIYSEIIAINPETSYIELDIEDRIVNEIALHLYNTARIQEISKEAITAYYHVNGVEYNESLAIIEGGNHFPEKDYAILKDGGEFKSERIVIDNSDELSIGEEIYVIGYPYLAVLDTGAFPEPTITRGIVSSKKLSEAGVEYIQIDAATSEGSSGGPVFNKYGEVVGILTAGAGESFNFVLPSKYFMTKL